MSVAALPLLSCVLLMGLLASLTGHLRASSSISEAPGNSSGEASHRAGLGNVPASALPDGARFLSALAAVQGQPSASAPPAQMPRSEASAETLTTATTTTTRPTATWSTSSSTSSSSSTATATTTTPKAAHSTAGATAEAQPSSAVARHGRLRIDGSTVVGEHGEPVRLRGVSLFWSQWMGRFWNARAVQWLRDDWNITLLRAAMGVEHDGFLSHPSEEQHLLEQVVDAAIEAGIYVIIDWHDHHAAMHVDRAKSFFQVVAQKYGSYPNVLFEVFNEPTDQDWARTIKPYHEQVVSVIRQHTDNIIILGTRTWSQDVDEASRNPVAGQNLAYTVHFYASTHRQSLRDKISAAMANGVAIFATEWGVCSATGDGSLDFQEAGRWLAFFRERGISDANWAIDDKEESCAALRPGASSSGGWTEQDLTRAGKWVRDSLRAR